MVLGLAALHAALFFLAFHPMALFPLAWVAFAPFAVIVARGRRDQALAGGLLAAAAGGGASVAWLTLFGPEPWAATAFGFGLYGMLMAALGRALAPRWPAALWLPLVVVAQEHLRGHLFFWAFPWVFLAHSQYPLDWLIQSADLGGAALIGLPIAAFSGVIADAFLGVPRRTTLLRGALVLASAGALAGYGAWRRASIEVVEGGPLVLAVQGNIPQELKNASERRPDLLRTHYNLTMAAAEARKKAKEPPVALVVWPETMVPIEWNHKRGDWPYDPRLTYASLAVSPRIREWFQDMGRFTRAHMLVGSIHCEVVTGSATANEFGWEARESNSAFLLSPEGTVLARYDKMFPAPMSEYTPFHESWPAAYRFLRETFVPPGFSQFTPGRDVPAWEVGGWKIGASVCFDITFPSSTNRAVRNGADAIVNLSNYGWFKDSAELDLARVQTIFRAIETRRGVVAVCNGGISSFVDPLGRAEDIVKPDPDGFPRRKLVEGTLARPLATSRTRTLFVAWGEWAGAAATFFALLFAGFSIFGRARPSLRKAGS
jgi:apolipoprotein N-acyltransferase